MGPVMHNMIPCLVMYDTLLGPVMHDMTLGFIMHNMILSPVIHNRIPTYTVRQVKRFSRPHAEMSLTFFTMYVGRVN
jgi:hypothetical protein